ncbi:larval cuticle protein III/IV-like [Scaptodrosophila lebanonensis]|uniref:Larval cuticle protein III/IV-like n=1 Tax=Drosophila lebanonensis TaxID=7225 RepID=A0A6J2ULT8_DROLE|nr:larval cuticle protein III/IV-like [Scaptodrosophila lebanonensis]
MFKFLLICAIMGLAAAGDDAAAQIESLENDVRPDGFSTSFKTSNGIAQTASGDEHGNIQGQYSFTSPEGVPVQISYVADENGYVPTGDQLPVPPPIPEAILRAIEYIKAHPPKEEN